MLPVLAVVSLGIALGVHELGHALAARLARIPVHRIALGVGPRLFSRFWGRTEWVVRLLPLWAASEIEVGGEAGERPGAARRILTLLAGPVVSAGFGVGLLFVLYLAGTHVPVALTVGEVEPGSEAARAQLRPGDRIVAVDGVPLESWRQLLHAIDDGAGRQLVLRLERDGTTTDAPVTPKADARGAGRIGVSQQYVYRAHAPREALVGAAGHAWTVLRDVIGAALSQGRSVARLGPAGGGLSLDGFLRVLAAVSLLLGALHLVPVPPLDGGNVLLAAIERARRKDLTPTGRALIQLGGFAVMLALAVLLALARAG